MKARLDESGGNLKNKKIEEKKKKIGEKMSKFVVLLLALVSVLSSGAMADVLPPGQKGIDVCTRISNPTAINGVKLFYVTRNVMSDDNQRYSQAEIIATECLPATYKLNSRFLVPVNTQVAANFQAQNYTTFFTEVNQIEGSIEYVAESSPLASKEIIYTLVQKDFNTILAYVSRIVRKYNDGTPDQTTSIEAPQQP